MDDMISRAELALKFGKRVRELGEWITLGKGGSPGLTTGKYSRSEWIAILEERQQEATLALGMILPIEPGNPGEWEEDYMSRAWVWLQANWSKLNG